VLLLTVLPVLIDIFSRRYLSVRNDA
jgi:hypothetical protein